MKTFECVCKFGDRLTSQRIEAETRNKARYAFFKTHFPKKNFASHKVFVREISQEVLELELRLRIAEDVIVKQQIKMERLRKDDLELARLQKENEEMKVAIRRDIDNVIRANQTIEEENATLLSVRNRLEKENARLVASVASDHVSLMQAKDQCRMFESSCNAKNLQIKNLEDNFDRVVTDLRTKNIELVKELKLANERELYFESEMEYLRSADGIRKSIVENISSKLRKVSKN